MERALARVRSKVLGRRLGRVVSTGLAGLVVAKGPSVGRSMSGKCLYFRSDASIQPRGAKACQAQVQGISREDLPGPSSGLPGPPRISVGIGHGARSRRRSAWRVFGGLPVCKGRAGDVQVFALKGHGAGVTVLGIAAGHAHLLPEDELAGDD